MSGEREWYIEVTGGNIYGVTRRITGMSSFWMTVIDWGSILSTAGGFIHIFRSISVDRLSYGC